MIVSTVFCKNELGFKIDSISKDIFKKYTRFYGSDAKNFKYACAVSTLPGGFSTFFLGFDSKEEMKNAIGDIVVKTKSGFRDSTNKFVDTYNEEKKGVAKLLLHPVEDYPQIAFGTGKSFEEARLNSAL